MKLIPAFLGLFDFDVNKNSFDGNLPVAAASFSGKTGDFAEIIFEKPTSVNLITLFEKGESVTDFEIYAESESGFEMIYKQERISKFRVCAIKEVTAKRILIKIVGTRKGRFGEIKAFAYMLPKKKTQLRKTAYVVTEKFEDIDFDNIKFYNKFNVIGNVDLNENGEITYKEDRLHGTLKMLRSNNPDADIVVTLGGKQLVKAFRTSEAAENIKKFIDEFELNGISFDWEYPKGPYEWRVFDRFIIKLKETIGEKTITLALASWLRYHFSKKALAAIDVAEIMTYDDMPRDIDGHHSEFFIDGPNAVYHFVQKGFKLSQLNLGLPYYARPVDGSGYWKDYKAEVDKMDKFTNLVHGDYEDIDAEKKKIIVKSRFYNSCQMIADKTAFCIYGNVGGVMVWHIGIDAPASHELCLSKALNNELESRTEK